MAVITPDCVNPDRCIKIKWASSKYVFGRNDGIRVRFDVISADGMPEEIFAYRMLPLDPQTGQKVGFFSHVSSPSDLAEYPINEPTPGLRPEWFRLTYIDVLVRSEIEAEAFIEDVRGDVRRLKRSLDAQDCLMPPQVENIGVPCGPFFSSSSSSAASASSSSSESLSLSCPGSEGPTLYQNVGFGNGWFTNGDLSTVVLCPGQVSKLLLIQGFALDDVPAGAIIGGIEAKFSCFQGLIPSSESSLSSESSSSASASSEPSFPCPLLPPAIPPADGPVLSIVQLYHPDLGLVGEDKGLGTLLPLVPTPKVFGGEDDLWSYPWTADLVKRGAFGFGLLVLMPAGAEGVAIVTILDPTLEVCFG